MLNAKEANKLVESFRIERMNERKAKAQNWVEKEVAPLVEEAAREGFSMVAIANELSQEEQRFAIQLLNALDYRVSAAHHIVKIRW